MALNSMPAIDAATCSGWTENQQNLYNALPFYLAKIQIDRKKTWPIWAKLTKKRRWKPNQGNTMRGVRVDPSPNMRQFAFPNLMSAMPKKDVMNIREVTSDVQLYRHRFESPIFNFYPEFNDFLSHIEDNGNDIMEKIERFNDLFIRGNIFHQAPWVFVSTGDGVKLIPAPTNYTGTGQFDETNQGKNTAFLSAVLPQVTGGPSIAAVVAAITQMETELRVPFFSGGSLPKEDQPLDGKFLFITSAQAFNSWTFDPWVKQNKTLDFDIVNNGYRGSLLGRVTTRLEDLPLRYKIDGTYAQPELRDNITGETLPNEEYSQSDADSSPYEVGFLAGANGYESIDVGPPPAAFTKEEMPDNFPGMFWNGAVKLTKNFPVPCVDATTGSVIYEGNAYGEYVKFISQVAMGILATQRRNVIPFIYKRQTGVAA